MMVVNMTGRGVCIYVLLLRISLCVLGDEQGAESSESSLWIVLTHSLMILNFTVGYRT